MLVEITMLVELGESQPRVLIGKVIVKDRNSEVIKSVDLNTGYLTVKRLPSQKILAFTNRSSN
jgi:hypothetical protein